MRMRSHHARRVFLPPLLHPRLRQVMYVSMTQTGLVASAPAGGRIPVTQTSMMELCAVQAFQAQKRVAVRVRGSMIVLVVNGAGRRAAIIVDAPGATTRPAVTAPAAIRAVATLFAAYPHSASLELIVVRAVASLSAAIGDEAGAGVGATTILSRPLVTLTAFMPVHTAWMVV